MITGAVLKAGLRLHEWRERWFPRVRNLERTRAELAQFYATRSDYHAMTAVTDKLDHPQVKLFLSMVESDNICVEFGCGCGVVFGGVAQKARLAIGMDISAMSLVEARKVAGDNQFMVVQADAARPPVRSGCADAVYSFEVLEHVWNPQAVISEMVRVLKPGGLIFFTTPNGYSLDLHLQRKTLLRAIDTVGAAFVWAMSKTTNRVYSNMEPDLDARPVYPDCDMISTLIPSGLERLLKQLGCHVERIETYFFQKHKAQNELRAQLFDRLERHPFYRHFGDHILVVARKRTLTS